MVQKVNRSKDCGNSPKNKMVEDIAVALEMCDTTFLSDIFDADVTWTYSGGSETSVKAILDILDKRDKPAVLTIDHVMSHGKVGAVNGYIESDNGAKRFCHVIEFTSVKCNSIRRIESYGG